MFKKFKSNLETELRDMLNINIQKNQKQSDIEYIQMDMTNRSEIISSRVNNDSESNNTY